MTKVALNQKIINAAKAITSAMENEAEEILKDTEDAVKGYFPAKYAKAALRAVEKELDNNGLEVTFQKELSKELRAKTASIQATPKELHETIKTISKAAVDEFEDMLADANEVANRVLTRFAAKNRPEIEAKLKNIIENRMRSCGIFCAFDRVTYDPQTQMKKTLASIQNKNKKVAAKKKSSNRIIDAMLNKA